MEVFEADFGASLLIAAIIATASIAYSGWQAGKQESRSFKAQTEAARQQAIKAGREQAIQQAPLSAEQMKMVMGAREIEDLVQKFNEQDRTEPVIYTLPTAEPTSAVERINRAIADFFRK